MSTVLTNDSGTVVEQREGNTILELVAMAVESDIERTPEGRAAHGAANDFVQKVKANFGYEAACELEDAIRELRRLYAHECFKAGWDLGRNPEKLADVIEPG